MDSYTERQEHESSAKRIKLDFGEFNTGVLCNEDSFSNFSSSIDCHIAASEGVAADCDSDYEASAIGYLSTPTHDFASPNTDGSDLHESLSSSSISQDSMEPEEDNASTVSNLSDLSGISELSGSELKDCISWLNIIQKQVANGVDPRTFLDGLGVDPEHIPAYVDDLTLWKWIINMVEERPRRHKLRHVNTLDDVVRLLKGAKNVIVLTGAGVSVSCGIPDFRSKDGIYSRQDPRPFFKFARDIYPGKFKPSPCHRFIKLLEKHQKLLRNYTQNIDTLEKVAEIERVVECHGSFATATCTKCDLQVTAEMVRDIILTQNIPVCEVCQPTIGKSISIEELKKRQPEELKNLVTNGIMKPDIVFFGEGLPDKFHDAMAEDKSKCDLLLVIGSSLKVHPVALIPTSLPANVPQILINREPLPHCHFDVELLGDCDVIINHICQLLGNTWSEAVYHQELLKETIHLLPWPRDQSQTETKPVPANSSFNFNVASNESHQETWKCKTSSVENLTVSELHTTCSYTSNLSIISKDADISSDFDHSIKLTKERHMSIDSARDSGIGENSNFADTDPLKSEEILDEVPNCTRDDVTKMDNSNEATCQVVPSIFGCTLKTDSCTLEISRNDDAIDNLHCNVVDMRGFWEPKQKRSITERLPENSFYLIAPSRNSTSDSSESESEVEKPESLL
ncbi:Sir2 family [Popillia japonica]|uniref:Sir2 family n=1 Tax=Popillia japonica TaxID=7064 RepID=A0AAW1L389_POPJA